MNNNPHDAPPELLAQAYRIALYFAERGIKDWTLGPIQKRSEAHGSKAILNHTEPGVKLT